MISSFWKRMREWTQGTESPGNAGPVEPVAPEGTGTIRMSLTFFGRVQGVGFRFMAVTLARPRGLTGWVKNEFDGSVSMEVQGAGEDINALVTELHHQRFIRIERIESRRITVDTHETSFRELQ